MDINEILVVFDPTRDSQPALERAKDAAMEIGAKLRVFACIYSETPKSKTEAEHIKQQISTQKHELEGFANEIRAAGITVDTEVEWDKNWYKAVVRATLRGGCDIVFKSTYKHSVGKRILNQTSDWTLIRECLCPVLLVREDSKWDTRKALAAIDIRAEKENYLKLNDNIVQFSKNILSKFNTEVHFINAYSDTMAFPDRNQLIELCGVETQKIHIDMGSPEDVIVDRAKNLNASMVVIGSSRRSGMSALVEGNTVEKVLDELHCDLLSIP